MGVESGTKNMIDFRTKLEKIMGAWNVEEGEGGMVSGDELNVGSL